MPLIETAVTVTLDGRILVRQGHSTIELTTPAEAEQVAAALAEALALSRQITGETD